nr:unnamed protein product [Callosobruchus chinensis]
MLVTARKRGRDTATTGVTTKTEGMITEEVRTVGVEVVGVAAAEAATVTTNAATAVNSTGAINSSVAEVVTGTATGIGKEAAETGGEAAAGTATGTEVAEDTAEVVTEAVVATAADKVEAAAEEVTDRVDIGLEIGAASKVVAVAEVLGGLESATVWRQLCCSELGRSRRAAAVEVWTTATGHGRLWGQSV